MQQSLRDAAEVGYLPHLSSLSSSSYIVPPLNLWHGGQSTLGPDICVCHFAIGVATCVSNVTG